MIRLRTSDGAIAEVPQATFVEVIGDADGKLCTVIHQAERGKITQIMPGTVEASRYEQMFRGEKLLFKPVINLPSLIP